MKIDFQTPDSHCQIQALRDLLQNATPTEEDVAAAMLITLRIFYPNRLETLKDLPAYFIHGKSCHNPISDRTNKAIMGIFAIEITIRHGNGKKRILTIKQELVDGGYFKAVFKNGRSRQTITADVLYHGSNKTLSTRSASTNGTRCDQLMEALGMFLKEPIDGLLRITEKELLTA